MGGSRARPCRRVSPPFVALASGGRCGVKLPRAHLPSRHLVERGAASGPGRQGRVWGARGINAGGLGSTTGPPLHAKDGLCKSLRFSPLPTHTGGWLYNQFSCQLRQAFHIFEGPSAGELTAVRRSRSSRSPTLKIPFVVGTPFRYFAAVVVCLVPPFLRFAAFKTLKMVPLFLRFAAFKNPQNFRTRGWRMYSQL